MFHPLDEELTDTRLRDIISHRRLLFCQEKLSEVLESRCKDGPVEAGKDKELPHRLMERPVRRWTTVRQ